jgi:multidrug efflux pump
VFGGMLAATTLAIFFIPVFFVVIFTLAQKITGKTPAKAQVSQGETA